LPADDVLSAGRKSDEFVKHSDEKDYTADEEPKRPLQRTKRAVQGHHIRNLTADLGLSCPCELQPHHLGYDTLPIRSPGVKRSYARSSSAIV
jgi:hypothetical protein